MHKSAGEGLPRGWLVALTLTTLMTAACGGGGGGAKSAAATGSSDPNNSAPTISGKPDTRAETGSTYRLAPVAHDADGDTLAFTIENRPAWAVFNTATGELTGTPGESDLGTSDGILITVSDGKARAVLPAFSITVARADRNPGEPGSGVTLSWDIPTQALDGSNLDDLTGYRIHYGRKSTALVHSIEIKSPGVNTYTVGELKPGTYYFAIRAVTADGAQSKLSNVISRKIG